MDDAIIKAAALIQSIAGALKSGIKHYDKEGKALITVNEVLACLKKEGSVVIERGKGE